MNSSWIKGLALLAVFALLAPVAYAQTTGRIEGRVVTEGGEALPGVTVEVSSPSLQGSRIAVTDADGRFRFLNLPPGDYNLEASLEGFTSLEQPSIQVRLDRAVTLALTMPSAEFGAEMTVTGAAPIIDTTSTTSGANFDEALIEDLPTTRTFTGLAFQAPGVVSGGLGRNPSIGGASAAENRYIIDGLDTTNAAFGTVGTAVPTEFVREVEVKTGGFEAEYGGSLGGVVNVITKSGGNELEGDIFGYYNDDSLQEETPPVPTVGQNLGFEEYDFGAALGGKIIQDKLWYFAAVNPSYQDSFLRTLGGLEDTEELDRVYYSGKLTWQLDPNHQLVASGYGDPGEGNDTRGDGYGRIGTNDEFGANNLGLTYNGAFGSSVFAEAAVGTYEEEEQSEPYDGFDGGSRYSINTTAGFVRNMVAANFPCGNLDPYYQPFSVFFTAVGCEGATFRVDDNRNSRDEARASLTWFGATGGIDHEVKLGGTVRNVEYEDSASYPGRDLTPFFDSHGALVDAGGLRGSRIELRGDHVRVIDYDQNSAGETDEQAVFLQDSIRFNDYFTLNLGVRADSFESRGVGSDNLEASGGLPRHLDFSFGDMVAPRVGFTWDTFQNGRSKLYGHFGRFYESVPLDINVRAFGNELFQFYFFLYPEDANGNPVLPTIDNPGTFLFPVVFGTGTGVDPNLEPMYTEEALAGFEYEVMPNVAAGIKYVTRTIENVIEDISVTAGHTYFITNPGQEFCQDPVLGGPVLDDNTDAPIPGGCVQFPEAVREYEAVEFTLNKRFSNNWQLFGSAVWSENKGNYGGLFRQDNGQLDPNITSLFDLPSLLEGATGLLPNDREYQFKVYGSYLWPFRLTSGFYFQYLDGNPITQLGAHALYGLNERFVTPRGSFGRTPDVWNLDLHLQYPISLGTNELKLIVDVFNVTNEQEPTVVDQTWTFADPSAADPNCGGTDPNCPDGNPNFGEALAFQTPRTFRLGAKFSF